MKVRKWLLAASGSAIVLIVLQFALSFKNIIGMSSSAVVSPSSSVELEQKILTTLSLDAQAVEKIKNTFNTLQGIYKEYLVPFIKDEYNNNPFRFSDAQVATTSSLHQLERQFLIDRESRAEYHEALAKFFESAGFSVGKKKPRIAFCGTGGGYRAMILTLGYLLAFERLGLLNAFSYCSSLSGSTWFLAPWIMSEESVQNFKEKLTIKIKENTFNPQSTVIVRRDFNVKSLVDDIFIKFLYDQPLGIIDFYGALLAYVLFHEKGTDRQQQHLSSQRDYIAQGKNLFPIYTSVSMHKLGQDIAQYNWYEFNPFEVRNLDLNLSVPSYAFGSLFNGGKSISIVPEQSLGFLLGIFGSALAINCKDALRITLNRTEAEQYSMSGLEAVKYGIAKGMASSIEKNTSEFWLKARFFSAQVLNPFKGMSGVPAWLQGRNDLTLVDGGIDCNIPLLPLLRPERNIDVVIIGESSGDAATYRELEKALLSAKNKYGHNYVRVDDGNNNSLQFFKVRSSSTAPVIVYVNFLKDERVMKQAEKDSTLSKLIESAGLKSFNPLHCLASSFCSTFNFDYSVQDFDQLSGMAELNVMANYKVIAQFLAQELFGETSKEDDFPLEIGGF